MVKCKWQRCYQQKLVLDGFKELKYDMAKNNPFTDHEMIFHLI